MSLLTAYWRFRAEEVRAIADEMKRTKTKLILAGVAGDYERLARLFENGTLKLQTSPPLQNYAMIYEDRNSIVPLHTESRN